MRMEMHLSEYVLWMGQKKRKSNVTVLTPQLLLMRPAGQQFNFKTSMMNILQWQLNQRVMLSSVYPKVEAQI